MTGPRVGPLRHKRVALLAVVLALAVTVTGITVAGRRSSDTTAGSEGPTPTPASTNAGVPTSTGPTAAVGPTTEQAAATNGVLMAGFSVRAGAAGTLAAPPAPVVSGTPLAQTVLAQILHRLPDWSGTTTPGTDFRWPTQSLTKPAAGKTITQTFPATSDGQSPPTAPVTSPTGPLHVLRMQPEGSVPVAPFVSITFDQPMVTVGTVSSVEQLSDAAVPATVTPKVPGHWDWIGTETLRFTADSANVDRLPMATRYTITVPAGEKSLSGGTLATTATATFETPPPLVQTFTPGSKDPVSLHPVMLAVFNQLVDPATVLRSVAVRAGGKDWPVRVATQAEIAADPESAAALSAAPAGRTVALVPSRDFPAASSIEVVVKAGTRSAEGPLSSASDADFRFSTRSAMTLTGGSCADSGCEPGGPLQLTFSNPIDDEAFDPSAVTVVPAIPGGASITSAGNVIVVYGATQAATTYHVTVKAGVPDTFGQVLAADDAATITVGHADPRIYPFPTSVTTLDPMAAKPTVTVTTVGQKHFRERVFAVQESDWAAFQGWLTHVLQLNTYRAGDDLQAPAWPVLADRTVTVPGAGDQLAATALDLSGPLDAEKKLPGGRTQIVVVIEPIDPTAGDGDGLNRPTMTWVQSTTLAVDAIADQTSLHAWVTDLRTGAPVPGAHVTLQTVGGSAVRPAAVTDDAGLATIDLTSAAGSLLIATVGGQTALLSADMWGSTWQTSPQPDQLLWYVTDDRQTYRPGETVSVKGWVRRQAADTTLALSTPAGGSVAWSAVDGYGTTIGSGTAELGRLGGFDLTLTIPAGAHLGSADLHLQLNGASAVGYAESDHMFTIADFRTPAFEVTTHSSSGDPAVRGADLPLQADAVYYAGGPLADAPVEWQVQTATASYAPPGWSGYTFGVWTPWWYDTGPAGFGGGPCCDVPTAPDADVRTFHGTTDGSGSDYLTVNVGNLGKTDDGLPVTVVAQATVTDLNRQQIAGTTSVLVHPANYYVGLTSDSTFIKQGEKLTISAIATDIDGTAKAGRPITVTAARVVGGWGMTPTNSSSGETLIDPHTCTVTSAATPVTCAFSPTVGGQYRITATVTDERGRLSRTELTRWVAGPDGSVDTVVQEQSLTLIPDRQEYRPGGSATLLVASPIAAGTGLITLSHNGIVSTRTFSVSGGSAVVSVPITEAMIPGVSASVEVVGTVPRAADPAGGPGTRPAYATGQIDLAVSTLSRALTVTAKPRQSMVKPGGKTTIDVTVADAAGKPVPNSQFEVVVVDEAVLALSGDQLPDPLQAFYPNSGSDFLWSVYGRSTVMLGTATPDGGGQESAAASSAAASSVGAPASPSADGASGSVDTGSTTGYSASGGKRDAATGPGSATTPITQRSAFDSLALFAPTVTTGADGTAAIPVTLPDNLTRYRVMVAAVAGDDRFGIGESTITAGLPLTVRPAPPRFLNFGDKAQLPVVVQNLTDAAMTTDVVLQAANLSVAGAGTGPTAGAVGKTVVVPAHGRVEVRFAVSADQAGTARFRVAAVGRSEADDADAAEQQFPVYTPSTSETFATYGSTTGNTALAQQVGKPSGVIPAFGGLQVTTSSTALAQLTDAVDFVAGNDYASSDALACQITTISALGDVLQAFAAPGIPSPARMKDLVVSDIEALVAMQNDDGGFAYWERGDDSDPFNSIQAVQALLLAEKYGYSGSAHGAATAAVTKALPYLEDIDGKLPTGTSQQTRDTMDAYALAVRALAGQSSAASEADDLVAARGEALPMDAVGWLLPVVSAGPRQELLTRVRNAAVDDAGSVTFTQAVSDDSWTVLQSEPRTDAVIVDALLSVDPTSDLIGKVVNGLMAQQRGGRWNDMQDNTFALVSMRHYYDTYEVADPNFVAGVWLGDKLAGTHSYTGRTTEQTSVTIPTAEVIKQGNSAITLADNGSGRMYYRIALTTAPASLSIPALDRGFVVSRSYAGADNASDVTRDSKGVWHIKPGARVRVTLTMVSRSAQSHVAMTDPLPAGLEPLDPQLATTPKDLAEKNAAGADTDPLSWMPTWYDHQNLRDDRAEAFATWLQGGVYTYSYLAIATTPGTFVAPPATAQQVYAPETFGHSATDQVVVGS